MRSPLARLCPIEVTTIGPELVESEIDPAVVEVPLSKDRTYCAAAFAKFTPLTFSVKIVLSASTGACRGSGATSTMSAMGGATSKTHEAVKLVKNALPAVSVMPEFNGLIDSRYVPGVGGSARKFSSYCLGFSWNSGYVNGDEISTLSTVPSRLVRSSVKSLLSTPLTNSLKLMTTEPGCTLTGELIIVSGGNASAIESTNGSVVSTNQVSEDAMPGLTFSATRFPAVSMTGVFKSVEINRSS